MCPVELIDAIMPKTRDRPAFNRPVHIAVGLILDGYRDMLGLWVGPTGEEGAKQWLNMLTKRRNRGTRPAHCVLRRPHRTPARQSP